MQKIFVICDDVWHPAEVIEKGMISIMEIRIRKAFDSGGIVRKAIAVACRPGNIFLADYAMMQKNHTFILMKTG